MSENPPNQIRPIKSAFEFYYKMCLDEQIARNRGTNNVVQEADILQSCQQRWQNMPDREKQRFIELENKDFERHQTETGSYGKGRSVHPKSAFFIFSHAKRDALHRQFPQFDEFKIAQECGKLWNQLSPAEKHEWEQKAYEGNL